MLYHQGIRGASGNSIKIQLERIYSGKGLNKPHNQSLCYEIKSSERKFFSLVPTVHGDNKLLDHERTQSNG